MEKIAAEGLLLHRACLKCHHCHTNLRLGGYAFDRGDPSGRFYCTQHYRLPAKVQRPIPRRSAAQRGAASSAKQAQFAATATTAIGKSSSPSTGNANAAATAATSAIAAAGAGSTVPKERNTETPERIAARERREGIARLDLLKRGYYAPIC